MSLKDANAANLSRRNRIKIVIPNPAVSTTTGRLTGVHSGQATDWLGESR